MKFPADKFHQNFIDLFPSDKKEAREKLKELLAELESIPDAFCGAAWLTSQEFAYISPKVEAILGYPYSNFFEGGVLFFYTTIPSENIESIKHQTEKHFQQLFHPSFKIESHQMELPGLAMEKELTCFSKPCFLIFMLKINRSL
jgi:hypothetical protein